MFERILCVARSSDGPTVGHIQLADQLIDAVVSWSENSLAQPEPEGLTLDHVNLIGFALGREPWATWLKSGGCLESAHCEMSELLLAAITRYARPAIEPVPVEEDVPHEEILRLAAEEIGYEFTGQWFLTGGKGLTLETNPLELLNFAHAILARWGRPTIEPVPDTKAHELLNLLLDDLDALVDSSEGVAGLHLNGDVASWESLREGGRFGTWLMRMDEARAFLDSTMDKPDDIATTIEPVPVSERPWERARWCDAEGRCWWGRVEGNPGNPEWFLAGLSEIEGFYEIGDWIVLLPHHALPVPTARRPKPPSAKQQALYALDEIDGYAIDQLKSYTIHDDLKAHVDTIRRALEAMPDDIT